MLEKELIDCRNINLKKLNADCFYQFLKHIIKTSYSYISLLKEYGQDARMTLLLTWCQNLTMVASYEEFHKADEG